MIFGVSIFTIISIFLGTIVLPAYIAWLIYKGTRPGEGYSDIKKELLTGTDTPGVAESKGVWLKVAPSAAPVKSSSDYKGPGEKIALESILGTSHEWYVSRKSTVDSQRIPEAPECYLEEDKILLYFSEPKSEEVVFAHASDIFKQVPRININDIVDAYSSNQKTYVFKLDKASENATANEKIDKIMKQAIEDLGLFEEQEVTVKLKGVTIKPRKRYPTWKIDGEGITLDFSKFKTTVQKSDLVDLQKDGRINSSFQPLFKDKMKNIVLLDKEGNPELDEKGSQKIKVEAPEEADFVDVRDVEVNRVWKFLNKTTVIRYLDKGQNFFTHYNSRIADALEPCVKLDILGGKSEQIWAGQSLWPSYAYRPFGNKQKQGNIYFDIKNNPHWFIAGATRSGKTVFGISLITMLAFTYGGEFFFYDGKGSDDWRPLADKISRYPIIKGTEPEDVKLRKIAFVIHKFKKAQVERAALFAHFTEKMNAEGIPGVISNIYAFRKYTGIWLKHMYFVVEEAGQWFTDVQYEKNVKNTDSIANMTQALLQQAGAYGIHFIFFNQIVQSVAGGIPSTAKKNFTTCWFFSLGGIDVEYVTKNYTKEGQRLSTISIGESIVVAQGIQDNINPSDSGISTPQCSFPYLGDLAEGVQILETPMMIHDKLHDPRKINECYDENGLLLPKLEFDPFYTYSSDGSRPDLRSKQKDYKTILGFLEGGMIRSAGVKDMKRLSAAADTTAGSEGTNPTTFFNFEGKKYGLCLYDAKPSAFGMERDMDSCRKSGLLPFVISFDKKFTATTNLNKLPKGSEDEEGPYVSAKSLGTAVFVGDIDPIMNEISEYIIAGNSEELATRGYLKLLIDRFSLMTEGTLEVVRPTAKQIEKVQDVVPEEAIEESDKEVEAPDAEVPGEADDKELSADNNCASCGDKVAKATTVVCLKPECQRLRLNASRYNDEFKSKWQKAKGNPAEQKKIVKRFKELKMI
jgi:hypothetical protein